MPGTNRCGAGVLLRSSAARARGPRGGGDLVVVVHVGHGRTRHQNRVGGRFSRPILGPIPARG
jgi:hypothetical protein